MAFVPTAAEARALVPRVVAGLVLMGVGTALMVAGDLGLPPWSVLDQGISERTGVPIGTVSILVGALVLCAWVPLRQRPGLGTVLNIVVIGVTTDLVLLVVDTPGSGAARLAYLLVGAFLWGPGSGLYIGADLGPGPRDGLMTGLAARGLGSMGAVRTGIEIGALGAGWLLGGSVGLGTVVFAVTVGPNFQFFLPRLAAGPRGPVAHADRRRRGAGPGRRPPVREGRARRARRALRTTNRRRPRSTGRGVTLDQRSSPGSVGAPASSIGPGGSSGGLPWERGGSSGWGASAPAPPAGWRRWPRWR